MDSLQLKIFSPEGVVLNEVVEYATLPGTSGSFSIYSMHAPIISSLEKGEIIYAMKDGVKKTLEIGGGFVEVHANIISVCVDLVDNTKK